MTLLLTGFFFILAAQAADVHPVAASNNCDQLPGYTSFFGLEGQSDPFAVNVNQCVNGTLPGRACDIEGFGIEAIASTQGGEVQYDQGFVSLLALPVQN